MNNTAIICSECNRFIEVGVICYECNKNLCVDCSCRDTLTNKYYCPRCWNTIKREQDWGKTYNDDEKLYHCKKCNLVKTKDEMGIYGDFCIHCIENHEKEQENQ